MIEGKEVTSASKLSELFNDFYIDKVEQIQKNFSDEDVDQLDLLQRLIPKPEMSLDIKSVTVIEVTKQLQK